jgi:hypothetical protein
MKTMMYCQRFARRTGLRLQRLARRARGVNQWCFCLGFLALVIPGTGAAQEALQNLQAGRNAAASRDKQLQSSDYTVKSGDFRLLLAPSVGLEWNDNVNLSKTNQTEDVILTPAVGITSSYQLTQRNLLFLDITIGYDQYLIHPSWSTMDLNSASGTGLSFDVGVKDVNLNFHDWMRYMQDSSQNPQVANTADYGTFKNTAGLAASWDMNQIELSAGYDHQNVISTSSQFDNNTHASEMFFLRPSLQIHPQVTVGLEATAAFTTYDQNSKTNMNDNDAYTLGGFVEIRPSSALRIQTRGGFSTYQFNTSSDTNNNPMATADANSWYASVDVNHQIRESLAYGFNAGHAVQLGTQSDLTETWYARPNITWQIMKDLTSTTSLFYEHGKEGIQDIRGNVKETYDWYGGELSLRHPLTKHFSLEMNYRLTLRSSDSSDSGYTQNLVGLRLTYHP